MEFRDMPIKKKLMRVILTISSVILVVTCGSFFAYEYYSFRKSALEELSTLGQIISENSTAALAFQNQEDATEILNALRAEPHIVTAQLYGKDGSPFAQYYSDKAATEYTVNTDWEGYRLTATYLEGMQPIMKGDRKLGTLYIRSDLKAMYDRFRLYGIIVLLVIAVSFFLAYFISSILQKNISGPVLDLVETAKAVSQRRDFSVRAHKTGNDELGLLTDTFNQMLEQIQRQNLTLNEFNKILEQKVLERTAELEAVNKELDSFSYSISHDLRAPLRAIHGYMSIFHEDYYSKLDEEGQKLIDVVLRNSQRMGMLIDDLLAFSKLGRKEVSKGPFSMKQLVQEVWDEQKIEPGRVVEFSLEELPDVEAERNLIRQVWVNLISNALKYASHKEKTMIRISSEKEEKEITYKIQDNGAGFNMAYYDKLFGVFQRLHSQQEFTGTGVGLAIVQKILEKHKGKIWAEAKVDEGATFYFSLPI